MRQIIRIGIIGMGQIGLSHLKNYQEIAEAEVVAVVDNHLDRGRSIAQEYHIPHVYPDYRELLAQSDVEAVDVCLHNNLHRPITVAALEAGKHVYCEKPMAGSYRDAAVMYETARAKHLCLSIQLSTLFSPEVNAAHELIRQGMLGRIYHARSVGFRRRGRPYVDGYGSAAFVQKRVASGGALYDMGVYHIASLLYLMGNPSALRISGKTYQETGMDPSRREISAYDVEELSTGFVKLDGGVTLDIIEAWAVHLGGLGGSCLVGTRGGVQLEPFGYFQSAGDLDLDATADLQSFTSRLYDLRENADAYTSPQRHWVAALQGRVELLPTAELALNTMLISEGIYLSDRLGRELSAEEVAEASLETSLPV